MTAERRQVRGRLGLDPDALLLDTRLASELTRTRGGEGPSEGGRIRRRPGAPGVAADGASAAPDAGADTDSVTTPGTSPAPHAALAAGIDVEDMAPTFDDLVAAGLLDWVHELDLLLPEPLSAP